MSGHTKEPWKADEQTVRSEGPDCRRLLVCDISVRGRPYNETYDEAVANAARIVACVNAMAGIDDPVAFMRKTREEGR